MCLSDDVPSSVLLAALFHVFVVLQACRLRGSAWQPLSPNPSRPPGSLSHLCLCSPRLSQGFSPLFVQESDPADPSDVSAQIHRIIDGFLCAS